MSFTFFYLSSAGKTILLSVRNARILPIFFLKIETTCFSPVKTGIGCLSKKLCCRLIFDRRINACTQSFNPIQSSTFWTFWHPGGRLDLGDGQFSERCDVDGSFFNSDAIPINFWKSLTSPLSRLFSLTIGNNYFFIILLILGPIILGLFTDWLGSSERKLY